MRSDYADGCFIWRNFLKVLHIHSYNFGGGAETVFNITRYNERNSINYSGFLNANSSSAEGSLINFKYYGDYPKSLRLINYIFSFHNYKVLKDFLENKEVDIVHLHGFIGALSSSILLALKRMKRKKRFVIVQTLHDFNLACPNSTFFNYSESKVCEKCLSKRVKLYSFVNSCDRRGLLFSIIKGMRSILANNIFGHVFIVDKFIVPSSLMKDKLVQDGIESQKIVMIRNPFPVGTADNIFEKKNIICYFGRFSKEKDVPFIIDSFSNWKQKKANDFKLYLIGGGEEEANIKLLAESSSCSADIIITKFLTPDKLKTFIQPCKYFVMASRLYENAPMGMLEAVSLAIIPIVPDLGGMKEMVDEVLGIGRTYELGNMLSFVKELERLEKTYYEEIRKVHTITSQLTREFGVNKYLQRLSDLYMECLECEV